jgi:plasmid stabilization system protein ParE
LKVRLTKAAKADVEQAAARYEEKREGLGLQFTDRVLEAVEKIEEHPLGYCKVIGEARRIGLVQFPYNLWFKVEKESLVIACIHQRRDRILVREREAGVIEMPKREGPTLG